MLIKRITADIIAALLISAAILPGAFFTAGRILDSRLIMQSRYARILLSQDDSYGITDMITNPKRYDAFLKFIGAVTAAYVNFEMIPLNEAKTFAVIFESMGGDIAIEDFEYQNNMLTITGTAPDVEAAGIFRDALRERGYFASVFMRRYEAEDGAGFEIECKFI